MFPPGELRRWTQLPRFGKHERTGIRSSYYATITGLLTVVALMGCLVPAHLATRADRLIALRHE